MCGLCVLQLITIIAVVGSSPVSKPGSNLLLHEINENLATITESLSQLIALTANEGITNDTYDRDVMQTKESKSNDIIKKAFSDEKHWIRRQMSLFSENLAHIAQNNNDTINNLLERLDAANKNIDKHEADIHSTNDSIGSLVERLDGNLNPVIDATRRIQTDNIELKKEISAVKPILKLLLHDRPLQQWIGNINSYYYVVNMVVTWYEAKRQCENIGGYLVEIDNQEELYFIKGLFKTEPKLAKYNYGWIGGNDEKTEGAWTWSRDERVIDFTAWVPDEPNNSGGNEHCLHMYGLSGLWNDVPCSYEFVFICEAEQLS